MISPSLPFPDGTGTTPRARPATSGPRTPSTAPAPRRFPWVVVGMHKPCITVGMYTCEPGRGPVQHAAEQEGRPRAERPRAHLPAQPPARAGCRVHDAGARDASTPTASPTPTRPSPRAPAAWSRSSAPAASASTTSTPPTRRPATSPRPRAEQEPDLGVARRRRRPMTAAGALSSARPAATSPTRSRSPATRRRTCRRSPSFTSSCTNLTCSFDASGVLRLRRHDRRLRLGLR